MTEFTDEKSIEAFCNQHQRVIDNMIYQSVQANYASLKAGWQRIYSMFKMNARDNAIYVMFVNVHKKSTTNVHCDIVSITKYENASEYNRHVDLATT